MCDCAAKPICASVGVLSGLLCESTALGAQGGYMPPLIGTCAVKEGDEFRLGGRQPTFGMTFFHTGNRSA